MNAFKYGILWCKGEITEALILGSIGGPILIGCFLFSKLGETENAKSMILPFSVIGLIFITMGILGIKSNLNRQKRRKQGDYRRV